MRTDFPQGTITPSAFALLLRDAATLLRPPFVAESTDDGAPVLRALSDLHELFKPRAPRTAAKIVFYAAQVQRTSAHLLRVVATDAGRWAAKLELEPQLGQATPAADEGAGRLGGGDTRERPRIVELP